MPSGDKLSGPMTLLGSVAIQLRFHTCLSELINLSYGNCDLRCKLRRCGTAGGVEWGGGPGPNFLQDLLGARFNGSHFVTRVRNSSSYSLPTASDTRHKFNIIHRGQGNTHIQTHTLMSTCRDAVVNKVLCT